MLTNPEPGLTETDVLWLFVAAGGDAMVVPMQGHNCSWCSEDAGAKGSNCNWITKWDHDIQQVHNEQDCM